jgi:dTDP-4-amino-4,6-dideoxygalactose transaminase
MINVTKAYLPDREKFKTYVDRIFDSGWLTNNGALVQLLEERLRRYLGVRHVVLVANGTLALQVAYKALCLTGDVVTTPFSFVATTSSLVWEGLHPVFADIDRQTLCIDPIRIERAITANTSGIVPVHVYGTPCNVDAISEIAERRRLKVIYDASHAFGVIYNGKPLVASGDISTLSFHATKIFHTVEGGAILLANDELCLRVRRMINFGIISPTGVDCLGINAKMNEFQAAMGLCVLDDIDAIIGARKVVDAYYRTELASIVELPKLARSTSPNFGYFPIILQDEATLRRVMAALNQLQINPRRYFFPSLDALPYVKSGGATISQELSRRVLCLPIYPGLPSEAQARIVLAIKSVLS